MTQPVKRSKRSNEQPADDTVAHVHQNELGEARACACGGVNLAMGPMTLHFAANEVEGLYDLVHAARDMAQVPRREGRKASTRAAKGKVQGLLH